MGGVINFCRKYINLNSDICKNFLVLFYYNLIYYYFDSLLSLHLATKTILTKNYGLKVTNVCPVSQCHHNFLLILFFTPDKDSK